MSCHDDSTCHNEKSIMMTTLVLMKNLVTMTTLRVRFMVWCSNRDVSDTKCKKLCGNCGHGKYSFSFQRVQYYGCCI